MVSVTSAIKVVINLHNVEDVLSLKSPVLSVLVKYKSMLRPINHDFDKFATYFKASLNCLPNQIEEMPMSHVTL